jgi:hypothetical protein
MKQKRKRKHDFFWFPPKALQSLAIEEMKPVLYRRYKVMLYVTII